MELQTSGAPGNRRRNRWLWRVLVLTILVGAGSGFAIWESRTSTLQSRHLAPFAQSLSFEVLPGASDAIRFPSSGPYDKRLGYTRLPEFWKRLESAGYRIERQARFSDSLIKVADSGLFPPYREKDRAGLKILGNHGTPVFDSPYPRRAYTRFDAVPPLIVNTLLAIENRELLDERYPTHNPAIEWDRFFRASLEYPLSRLQPGRRSAGGSTLATQLVKSRHSEGGITSSVKEKLRQIASASLLAYQDGEQTLTAQQRIVVAYLNSLPLAAVRGRGEIVGLAAGLDAWHGVQFEEVNRLLNSPRCAKPTEDLAACALAYKQVLSLLIAQRRPTELLVRSPKGLRALTDSYLRVLRDQGVVPKFLFDAATAHTLDIRGRATSRQTNRGKTPEVIRATVAGMLNVPRLYDLDRMDLTVESTLDMPAQAAVTQMLRSLADRERVRAVGMNGHKLLEDDDDPSKVIYSFTLYERGASVNWLRVQTDSYDGSLNMAEGMKLDLGSTAKLRTLITYLQVVSRLHDQYSGFMPEYLYEESARATDPLSRWVLSHLIASPHMDRRELVEAAMDKHYSANPNESFFTGSGMHRFHNYNRRDDHRSLPVREAFRKSVNLIFIRMMRDVVRYYEHRLLGDAVHILDEPDHPRRYAYLERFAHWEGRKLIARYYRALTAEGTGLGSTELLDRVLSGVHLTPKRLATVVLSVDPKVSLGKFATQMHSRLPEADLPSNEIAKLYRTQGPQKYNLADRGYISRVHPLKLWLAEYLRRRPDANLSKVFEASTSARLEAYEWLFATGRKGAQNRRIRTMLEREAFAEIHYDWQQLGYPFGSLVPSYASSIGASGDRPSALAELVGIIINEGVRYPTQRIKRLRFAEGTPYETVAVAETPTSVERVLAPEVAEVVRGALLDTVENGTAVRAFETYVDREGKPFAVGGKTGTGDHRRKIYGPGARLIGEQVMNRTATFVFIIDDRFYGVVTAHVPGPEAGDYGFSSALAVQLFKAISPTLNPMVDGTGRTLIAARTEVEPQTEAGSTLEAPVAQ